MPHAKEHLWERSRWHAKKYSDATRQLSAQLQEYIHQRLLWIKILNRPASWQTSLPRWKEEDPGSWLPKWARMGMTAEQRLFQQALPIWDLTWISDHCFKRHTKQQNKP